MKLRQKFHRDGTVTFWSVYNQVWLRDPANMIPVRELAAMPDRERERILLHAKKFGVSK